MNFEKDLFISYAHLDNQPLRPEQLGWVTRFHKSLQSMLSTRLGKPAQIWRDVKLKGNDIFADEIVSQFPKTALLISVVTPRYVQSEWCTREVNEFCKCAETTGGLVVDNKSRLLKVIKLPVKNEAALPEVMRNALGYSFYIVDEQEHIPLELDPEAYGKDVEKVYNVKIAKLAFDVAEMVQNLTSVPVQAESAEPGVIKPSIYLAECGLDVRSGREAVESDLRLHGYPVLPDRRLPADEEVEFIDTAYEMMQRCDLSVHLVGSMYGVVPEGVSRQSITALQNEIGILQSADRGLRRLIWLPQPARSGQTQQQEFIDKLLRDPAAQTGADVIQGNLEDLKGAVHAALKKLEKPAPSPPGGAPAAEAESRSVYVLCDQRDRKATLPIRQLLTSRGIEPTLPLFDGDAAAVRQANQDALATCDAVLLYYGAADEAWKRSQESELKKAPAWRGSKQPLVTYTYLADPKTDYKEELIEENRPRVINGLEGFKEEILSEFLGKLATVA